MEESRRRQKEIYVVGVHLCVTSIVRGKDTECP